MLRSSSIGEVECVKEWRLKSRPAHQGSVSGTALPRSPPPPTSPQPKPVHKLDSDLQPKSHENSSVLLHPIATQVLVKVQKVTIAKKGANTRASALALTIVAQAALTAAVAILGWKGHG